MTRSYWAELPEDSPYRQSADGLAFYMSGRNYIYVYSVDQKQLRRYPLRERFQRHPVGAQAIGIYDDRNDVLRKGLTQLAGHFGLAKAQGRIKPIGEHLG